MRRTALSGVSGEFVDEVAGDRGAREHAGVMPLVGVHSGGNWGGCNGERAQPVVGVVSEFTSNGC